MEQQTQEMARSTAENRIPERQNHRMPERARLSEAGLTAKAIWDGLPLSDLPPVRLEELAGWLGNQNMEELLMGHTPVLLEAPFELPGETPKTTPFFVPELEPALTEPPQVLTVDEPLGAFDAAGLTF